MKQLKTLASIALAALCALSMAACQKNDGGSTSTNKKKTATATVPTNRNCQYRSNNYNSNSWYQYSNAGFRPYNNGNRNCGAGYVTICDARYGIICAPQNYFGNNIAWYGYGTSAIRFYGFGGYNHYSYPNYGNYSSYGWPYYGGYGNNWGYQAGYNTNSGFYFGRTCTVGVNSCGSGKFCQPTTWTSPIGVCVKN